MSEQHAESARRVLVVDDDEDTADLLVHLLQMHGHSARSVHTASEALATARDFRPEVAILDVGLPDMSGYELATALRNEQLGACKLIAVTGYSGASEVERSKRAGFDLHLVKPVDLQILAKTVAERLPSQL